LQKLFEIFKNLNTTPSDDIGADLPNLNVEELYQLNYELNMRIEKQEILKRNIWLSFAFSLVEYFPELFRVFRAHVFQTSTQILSIFSLFEFFKNLNTAPSDDIGADLPNLNVEELNQLNYELNIHLEKEIRIKLGFIFKLSPARFPGFMTICSKSGFCAI
jgi:hypothetical protein